MGAILGATQFTGLGEAPRAEDAGRICWHGQVTFAKVASGLCGAPDVDILYGHDPYGT